jgi:Rad3-related DNA helicase
MVIYNAELIPELLGPGGPLAAGLSPYEDRPFQRELALEVARLLDDGGYLAAEAPTGIGKSLGYGLPAAAWAAAGHGPVVISTHTKALQTQLLTLEAPRLALAVEGDLAVEVLKGRANYLCRRRYEAACAEASGEGTQAVLERLRRWVETTRNGDLGDCGIRNPRDLQFLHSRVAGDPRFCAGSDCTPQSGCFFKAARARAARADLLVVNHALLAIHLFGDGDLLPAHRALIVDEAHAFVRVALDHLGVSAGPQRVAALVESAPGSDGILPPSVRDGLGASRMLALRRSLSAMERVAREYFGKRNGARGAGDDRRRYRSPEDLARLCPLSPEALVDALGTLLADARAVESFVNDGGGEGDVEGIFLADAGRFAEETDAFRRDLDDLLHPDPADPDRVTWKEWGTDDLFSLNASPLEIGKRLAAALEEGPDRVVFTSATLAAGKDFSYFAREVGLHDRLHTVAYPSPFDFREQALAVAVRRGPDPREPGWAPAVAGTLDALMRDPARKTMALFTSYRDLDGVHAALTGRAGGKRAAYADPFAGPDAQMTLAEAAAPAPAGEGSDYVVLAQGSGGSAAELLGAFRRAERALLLGTASFWEGVDLPGDDLEVLVLTRLPFGVPTDPRYQARAERLEAEGGRPFVDLYLPEAVLRFKQGFGRLIRRRSDRGIVAVLDPRFLGKGYGRRFAEALPLPVTPVADGGALARAAAAWWARGAQFTRLGGTGPLR